jgi:glutamate synthase domain-containing protein 3
VTFGRIVFLGNMGRNFRAGMIIKEHMEYTGGAVGKQFLDEWDMQVAYFIKVMPHDYKMVL